MKIKLIFFYAIIHILTFLFSFVLLKQETNSYIYEYKIETINNKFDRVEDEKLLNAILFGETKKFFSYSTSINYLKDLMNENCGLPTAKFNINYGEQVYPFNLTKFNVTFELSNINKEEFQIDDCLYVWLDLAQQNFIEVKKKEIRTINQRISTSNAIINNLFKIKDNYISEDFLKEKKNNIITNTIQDKFFINNIENLIASFDIKKYLDIKLKITERLNINHYLWTIYCILLFNLLFFFVFRKIFFSKEKLSKLKKLIT